MEAIYAEEVRDAGNQDVVPLPLHRLGLSMHSGVMNVVPGNPGVNLDLGYPLVMELMRHHLLHHHHPYADNYFTSVHSAADLLQVDTYLCGTTRSTGREFPKMLANVHLQQGDKVDE